MLFKIACAVVDRPEFVTLQTVLTEDGATFTIKGHPEDTGKLIGYQGRMERSIHTITTGVGEKLGRSYMVVVNESCDQS